MKEQDDAENVMKLDADDRLVVGSFDSISQNVASDLRD